MRDALSKAEQLMQAGQYSLAEPILRNVLAQKPNNPETLRLLGLSLYHQRRATEAIEVLERYLKLNQNDVASLNALGFLIAQSGEKLKALALFEQAIQASPGSAEAHNNLGVTLKSLGRFAQAEQAFRRALQLRPKFAEAHNNLGNTLQKLHSPARAIDEYKAAIQNNPSYSLAYQGLASALDQLARPEDALVWRRKLLLLRPDSAALHSDLLLSTLSIADMSPQERLVEHLAWGERHAKPLYRLKRPHINDRTQDRPLRVGYVSPNFGAMATGWFVLPLLQAHDRRQVSVYCYSDISQSDWMTKNIQAAADHWRDTAPLNHQRLAELIRDDRVDILIDLRGHMARHRLLTFAMRPAPLQMSYIGYMYTVGFDAMDYRICDEYTDPVGSAESPLVEKPARLQRTICCYRPHEEITPASLQPAKNNGYVTFGVFQKPGKLNRQVLECWTQVLHGSPGSKLMILCPGEETLSQLRVRFAHGGIDPQRILPAFHTERRKYLCYFNDVDLVLDTFPYAGVTTTCDALWMGVPVLTLLGPAPYERAGAGLLASCGLTSCIASTAAEYIGLALRFARESERAFGSRRQLREKVRASDLMDADGLARGIEAVFRQAWVDWTARR